MLGIQFLTFPNVLGATAHVPFAEMRGGSHNTLSSSVYSSVCV